MRLGLLDLVLHDDDDDDDDVSPTPPTHTSSHASHRVECVPLCVMSSRGELETPLSREIKKTEAKMKHQGAGHLTVEEFQLLVQGGYSPWDLAMRRVGSNMIWVLLGGVACAISYYLA